METEDKELGAMAWVLKMDDATIESGLVHDFDASLSGIGQELGAGAYSMRLETGSTCLQLLVFLTKCTLTSGMILPVFLTILQPVRWLSIVYCDQAAISSNRKYHKDVVKKKQENLQFILDLTL